MSLSTTSDIALHASSPNNQTMYDIVFKTVQKHGGLTTDEIADILDKPNHIVSSRVAYLVSNGYLEYTPARRLTRNGCEAEVLECTGKQPMNGIFHCPIRETQKNFLIRIMEYIELGNSLDAIKACEERYNSLRR
jgi:hypothetical protein